MSHKPYWPTIPSIRRGKCPELVVRSRREAGNLEVWLRQRTNLNYRAARRERDAAVVRQRAIPGPRRPTRPRKAQVTRLASGTLLDRSRRPVAAMVGVRRCGCCLTGTRDVDGTTE